MCREPLLRFARSVDDGGLGEALDRAAAAMEDSQGLNSKPSIRDTSSKRARALWRVGWLGWWTQLILSVVSAVRYL